MLIKKTACEQENVRASMQKIAHEAEWAIDSEAIRARGIIVLVNPTSGILSMLRSDWLSY